MKTRVCTKLTVLRYKTGLYVTTEPIFQAISDCYDQTGFKTTNGIEKRSTGICPEISFHLNLN